MSRLAKYLIAFGAGFPKGRSSLLVIRTGRSIELNPSSMLACATVIAEVGYEEYFLTVWDMLQECRREGIEWITRGSAADSLVCYCLGISGVCPIRFDLYFRRFLNRDRMALNKLPDIDLDFPHDRKDDVVDLIFRRFGIINTAIVGGFSTFQARSALAEIGKVLGMSDFQVRRLTEQIPNVAARDIVQAVSDCVESQSDAFAEEPARTAVTLAAILDGFPRYPKMHPCGMVFSRDPILDHSPTFMSAKGYLRRTAEPGYAVGQMYAVTSATSFVNHFS